MELAQRSLQGGILILAILLIRSLWLDRLPKRTFPILWTVALARLLMPFSFSSGLSLYTLLQILQPRTMPEQATGAAVEGATMTGALPVWTVAEEPGLDLPVLASGHRLEVLWVIWWVGVILMALFFVSAYLWSLWNFRRALPVENEQVQQWLDRCGRRRKGLVGRIEIRQWDQTLAPLTYGCLHPVILLPQKALWDGGQELEFILQHEFMHIRHYDGVLKLVMTAVLCMHWFNPLVWIMCRVMNQDIELACDEAVLRSFGEPAKAKYAMALIGMEEKKRILLPFYSGFSKNAIEERISLIMKYKKIKYAKTAVSSVLVVLVALVFATSAKTAEATDNPALGSEGDTETQGEVRVDDLTAGQWSDGFETILSAIAASFGVLPRVDENLARDQQLAEEMVLAFWEAYLAGDQEGMRQYLVEDYTGDIEGFPDGVDGHVAKESVVNAVKGINMEPKMVGESYEFWVEFWPRAEADSLEYLTISAVKEADGWRIRWYGLEG